MDSSSIWDFKNKNKIKNIFCFSYSKRAGFKLHAKFINRKELLFFVWK
jgi:hypothetical protein